MVRFFCQKKQDLLPHRRQHPPPQPRASRSSTAISSNLLFFFTEGNMEFFHDQAERMAKYLRKITTCSTSTTHHQDVRISRNSSSATVTCDGCGAQFGDQKDLDQHFFSKHAVTELVEGDPSREYIVTECKKTFLTPGISSKYIKQILKIHNTCKTLDQYEEYRELVKRKEVERREYYSVRIAADGNEMFRFYWTTVRCSLGTNASFGLCGSKKCGLCQILRHGFSCLKDVKRGEGVRTHIMPSTQAFLSKIPNRKFAVIACKVIVGREYNGRDYNRFVTEENKLTYLQPPFKMYDSVQLSNWGYVKDTVVLNPHALLPCYIFMGKGR